MKRKPILRCTILMDLSQSMYYLNQNHDKIKFSVYCAAALTHLMISQRDAVGLMGFSEDIKLATLQKSSRSHLHRLLLQLDHWLKLKMRNLLPLRLLKVFMPPQKNQSSIIGYYFYRYVSKPFIVCRYQRGSPTFET